MILCHKCRGILASREEENKEGLYGCHCISGYVRGFEKNNTRREAILAQIKNCADRIDLYKAQNREAWNWESEEERKAKLEALLSQEKE